jgi:hypothetical protein
MTSTTANPGAPSVLARVDRKLLTTAAAAGLLGGVALFLVMAGYNASAGMGFLTILNVCFAAWVFRGAAMAAPPMAERHMAMTGHHATMAHNAGMSHAGMAHPMGTTMMNEPLQASHVIVGGLLHLGMSAVTGVAFAVALALLIRAGGRIVATPFGYIAAGIAGGALLYVIMMYGFAPLWNTEIVDFTPRVPFLLSHLLFGAIVGGWVYLRLASSRQFHVGVRPQFGGTG